jgi:hypothetical protein
VQLVAGHFHGLAGGQIALQGFGDALAATFEQLRRGLEAQKLLQRGLAAGGGLPQQQVRRLGGVLGQGVGGLGGQQGADAVAPQPQRQRGGAGTVLQVTGGPGHVGQPAGPGGVAEAAGAVATAQKVELQHRQAAGCQRAGLHRSHAAALVHLFGKGVHVQHEGACRALRGVEEAEARGAVVGAGEVRLGGHGVRVWGRASTGSARTEAPHRSP